MRACERGVADTDRLWALDEGRTRERRRPWLHLKCGVPLSAAGMTLRQFGCVPAHLVLDLVSNRFDRDAAASLDQLKRPRNLRCLCG